MKSDHSDLTDHLTPARQFMIRACLAASGQEQEDAVRAWEEVADISGPDFSSSRLVPYFFHRNTQQGISSRHDKRLKVIYKHWWLRTQHITHQLRKVHAALFDAGIEAVVIKGAAIMRHYDRPEHRPMADFDLLVPRPDLYRALEIIRECGYLPDQATTDLLKRKPGMQLDFTHAIPCTHPLADTKLDLHWRIGSRCSARFSAKVWNHLEPYDAIPNARKPQLAYEVFMLIIQAIDTGSRDNLNWILDIHRINSREDRSFWPEARELAVAEKKEDQFDYGCAILLNLGLYAPAPEIAKKPKAIINISEEERQRMNPARLNYIRFHNVFYIVSRLYPRAGVFGKLYQAIRWVIYMHT